MTTTVNPVPGSEETPIVDQTPRPWQKAMLLVVALVVIVHTALVAVWLAPSSPIRDSVGQSTLSTYVDPYFQQSWESIDPQSQRVDETLQYRARILDVDTKKTSTTAWLDLTGLEDRILQSGVLRGGFQPARIHLVNRRLATNLTAATFAFGDSRGMVEDDYTEEPIGKLGAELQQAGAGRAAVANYLAFDQMTVQFLSMYEAARTQDEVQAVQYRVGRRTVPAYADRATATLKDTPFDFVTYGWRRGFSAQPNAQDSFDSYVGN